MIGCYIIHSSKLNKFYIGATQEDVTTLNEQLNELKNKRSHTVDEIIKEYNQLWDMMNILINAGRAIFRGIEEVKLREHTYSFVKKRVQSTSINTDDKTDEKIVYTFVSKLIKLFRTKSC